jgi:hypothetical protein
MHARLTGSKRVRAESAAEVGASASADVDIIHAPKKQAVAVAHAPVAPLAQRTQAGAIAAGSPAAPATNVEGYGAAEAPAAASSSSDTAAAAPGVQRRQWAPFKPPRRSEPRVSEPIRKLVLSPNAGSAEAEGARGAAGSPLAADDGDVLCDVAATHTTAARGAAPADEAGAGAAAPAYEGPPGTFGPLGSSLAVKRPFKPVKMAPAAAPAAPSKAAQKARAGASAAMEEDTAPSTAAGRAHDGLCAGEDGGGLA